MCTLRHENHQFITWLATRPVTQKSCAKSSLLYPRHLSQNLWVWDTEAVYLLLLSVIDATSSETWAPSASPLGYSYSLLGLVSVD